MSLFNAVKCDGTHEHKNGLIQNLYIHPCTIVSLNILLMVGFFPTLLVTIIKDFKITSMVRASDGNII